jgi:hypothetical protein
MPLNKALELLKSDYIDYINYLKSNHSKQNRATNNYNDFLNQDNENGNSTNSKPHILLDKRQKNLINILLTKLNKNSRVNMFELDLLITYLNKKKEEIVQDYSNIEQFDNDINTEFYNSNGNGVIPPLIQPQRAIGDLMSMNQPQSTQQPMPTLMGMNEFMNFNQPQQTNQIMNLGDLMSINQPLIPSAPLLFNPPPSLMSLMNQSQSLMNFPTPFGNNNNNQSGFLMNHSTYNNNRY